MRRRLTYANVMATLAFFFALTGASIAGVKYILATDPIPSTSDLTGTFGNPQIGAGKVTTAKVAGGAVTTAKVADGAITVDKLDGGVVNTYSHLVASGSFTRTNTNLLGQQCAGFDFAGGAGVAEGMEVRVTPPATVYGNPFIVYRGIAAPGGAAAVVCNSGTSTVSMDGDWAWQVYS